MDLQQVLQMLLENNQFSLAGKKIAIIALGEDEVDFATNMSTELLFDAATALAEGCTPNERFLSPHISAAC